MNGKGDIRIMPMCNPLPLWDEGSDSEYPDVLRMAFRNGKIRTYRLVDDTVQQPKPHVIRTEDLNRMFTENTYGGYKAKHAKK